MTLPPRSPLTPRKPVLKPKGVERPAAPATPRTPVRPAPAPRAAVGTASLKADDFTAFCELVRSICGVDLLQYKRNQMERRVRTWTERRGTTDLTEYGKVLRRDPEELDAFLDRVTINVSHLWRHEDQFDVLRKKILPELAERKRLKIWSAGSSYGAEAYTIAAVARETLPTIPVEIVGTDLDKRMVARAREGYFTAEDARTSPKALLTKHFVAREDGGWQAKPELKRMVRFENGDLLRMAVPTARYDVVFCRNTVIYFTEEVRDALHERLVKALSPGGFLVVGTSERVSDPKGLGLTSPYHFIYQKS
jgi:chemotaxis protein methyltransferase CheR